MKIEGFLKLFIDSLEAEGGPLYYDDDIDDGSIFFSTGFWSTLLKAEVSVDELNIDIIIFSL